MMSIETIRHIAAVQAKKAERANKQPLVVHAAIPWQGEALRGKLAKMPNFGDYRPAGWEQVGEYFVDSTGFGERGEAALTIGDFVEKVRAKLSRSSKPLGYAIIESGQFQVYIGEFQQVDLS